MDTNPGTQTQNWALRHIYINSDTNPGTQTQIRQLDTNPGTQTHTRQLDTNTGTRKQTRALRHKAGHSDTNTGTQTHTRALRHIHEIVREVGPCALIVRLRISLGCHCTRMTSYFHPSSFLAILTTLAGVPLGS